MEQQQGINFAAIPQTAVKVITSPAAFYREMPKKGGFLEPLVFMVVLGVVTGIIDAVLSLLGLQVAQAAMAGVMAIVIVPVAVLIVGFIGAAIMFVIWKLMGSQEDYETAYRCGAYACAFSPIVAILGVIPYAGMAIGIAIWVFLLVTASVEVHGIPSNKAWLVFGIIGLILIAFGITGQIAARKMASNMEDTAKQMQEAAQQMQQNAAQAQDAAIRQMEEQMKDMPPEQQEQMRKAIEQMKQARGGQ